MTSSEPVSQFAKVDPVWAWERYEPSEKVPWQRPLGTHLFRRAAFGGNWKELQEAGTRGPHATIDQLLQPPEAYPAFADLFDDHESAAARSGDGMSLDAWWLKRLRESPWPLLEKLTLFWHNYFAIRSTAVGDLKLMHAHVQMLRKYALSDFPTLLGALAGDPAMHTGLDGSQNRKARPNLQFARPWLEAFTVGPEATTAVEIRNLARAWTGWFVYGSKLRFIDREHDLESKTLLGREGNFGRDDAVRLLAQHPATARNVARHLFRVFIAESASPPDALLAPIATRVQSGARVIEVLETILRSNLFFSRHAVGQRIKSPVELAVGLVRSLEGAMPSAAVAEDLVNLGQRLDDPPTVHGWAGGAHWINTMTMAARLRLCRSLVRGSEPYGAGLDPSKIAAANGFQAPSAQAAFVIDLLLPEQLPEALIREINASVTASPQSIKAVLEMITARPEFQLS